jgi:hypothetical protein
MSDDNMCVYVTIKSRYSGGFNQPIEPPLPFDEVSERLKTPSAEVKGLRDQVKHLTRLLNILEKK